VKEDSWREGVSRRQSLITNKQFYALSSFRISCYTHGTFDFSDCYLNLCAGRGEDTVASASASRMKNAPAAPVRRARARVGTTHRTVLHR